MDPDSNVNNLNKSLSSFEEIATACMGNYKFRYYLALNRSEILWCLYKISCQSFSHFSVGRVVV